MSALKHTVAIALALVLPGCGAGEDARHVRVELELSTAECSAEMTGCSVHLKGSGIVIRADEADGVASAEGQSTLYAEVTAPSGALAMIEIAYGARGETKVQYREVADGVLLFDGVVSAVAVDMPEADGAWYESGEFSFRAEDRRGGQDNLRIVKSGRVRPLNPEQVRVSSSVVDDDPVYGRRGSTRVVIIVDDTSGGYYDHEDSGCEGDSVEPPPPDEEEPNYVSESDDGCDGDSSSSSSSSDSGCDGDSSSSSSSSGDGCDDGSSSSSSSSGGGCEGDSSEGGCDGSSSSSSSSGGGCDGCEGDAYASTLSAERAGPKPGKSPLSSLFRLMWPIALVAYFNRRQRRRLRS